MATDQSRKRLALAIIDFLSTSLTDGTLSSDDAESIEIAQNCIAESFGVDPADKSAVADALGGQNLLSIYSVYEKLKGKSTASTKGSSSAEEARPASPLTSGQSSDPGASVPTDPAKAKEEAEKLKQQGNASMQKKNYATAIDFYTKALDLVPLNPIFLSNRAAAYSGSQRHAEAREDAEMAVAADPKYTKAWSRLGLAKFALGDAKGSMESYQMGIDAEGNGGSEAMKRGYETAKKRVLDEGGDIGIDAASSAARGAAGAGGAGAGGMPDLGSLASMPGGGGGGGGGPGGLNLAEMMNNPMMRQMAQNMMSNPDALNNLMQNPRLRQMAEQFGGGGGGGAGAGGAPGAGAGAGAGGGSGMPDLSSLMNDPSIAEMARNFMGGMGGAGRGAPQ